MAGRADDRNAVVPRHRAQQLVAALVLKYLGLCDALNVSRSTGAALLGVSDSQLSQYKSQAAEPAKLVPPNAAVFLSLFQALGKLGELHALRAGEGKSPRDPQWQKEVIEAVTGVPYQAPPQPNEDD